MTEPDPLLAYRPRFPILAHTNYLISNSLGAVPVDVSAELQAYYEAWSRRGVRAWEEGWWTLAADVGDLVAPLIGAAAGEVVFQPSVTLAHAVIFSAVVGSGAWNHGRSGIVTDARHFPSILYLIREQRRFGARVEVVPAADAVTADAGRVIEAINESTALVCLSHVSFQSALIQDIAAIAGHARRMGALVVVDGYQAVGAIEVDVRSLNVDIYIGGCLKWLCGGPGAAFLWVRPELRSSLNPALTGWMAHARPFAFTPALERRADAWRFLHGTPGIASLYAARPGLRIIQEAGITAIRVKSMRQTARLMALAESRGWPCHAPKDPSHRGGTVALDVEHGREVSQALKARAVLCDFRPQAGIRLSPHFYTLDDELDAAVEAIEDILQTKAWKGFSGNAPTVT